MKIAEISTLLKQELYEYDYQYGFYFDGKTLVQQDYIASVHSEKI